MMMDNEPNWWGYLHANGTVQAKPVTWTYADDVLDAKQSPFVKRIMLAFSAKDRDDALAQLKKCLIEENK
jgi:hypothetical protein